ncbi:mechanosensitive ion channel family protein [Bacteroides helcogenes]|uniref:Mechanosensing system component YbdG n=1 Tax=Bacteroides helcogenes (strain ATCC 35417 / DSM 20613 / JCM 6297 / CCUG 15421 / P 36-108) TaxID=693979 RepID=E6STY3_BACT6|nr:mechanosensitive ion channel domain-containing protein [Bacteroides helcogenes]ADV43284.1 MscS Mechanosensitive ion channel [Bacteroides helcogenes P 36-108]MDY5238623.1 mechanosensitive ion channel [Bacteroides helcogenes]
MDILKNIDELLISWGVTPSRADVLDQFIAFALVLVMAFAADAICRNILLRAVAHLVKKTKATWDDILFDHKVMVHLSRLVAPVIIYIFVPVAFAETNSSTLGFIQRVCLIYIIVAFLSFVNSFLKAVYVVYSEKEHLRDRPLKGMLQTVQVILWFVGAIVVVGILIDKSPLSLLAGLGASAAILMLVFKDSIMGFVSGVQLSANDMLKVGDWIAMPKYGADGTVIEVTLNTVKVRNWDNTITTIPPYLLVSDSFQNWRGMQESGGRRVKRSINIDMSSVKFCTPQMLEKYRKIRLLKDYVEQTERVVRAYNEEHDIDNSILVNGRRQTNLGVFRAYLTAYLKSLPAINQNLTCMVRQLQPTDHGIPIELYFFCAIKEWVPYEGVQADVFDHVLAIIPEFDLQVFQSPSGRDFRRVLAD